MHHSRRRCAFFRLSHPRSHYRQRRFTIGAEHICIHVNLTVVEGQVNCRRLGFHDKSSRLRLLSPTELSLRHLRERGYDCDVVERWIPGANIRRDMIGIIDIVAWKPDVPGSGKGRSVCPDRKNARRIARFTLNINGRQFQLSLHARRFASPERFATSGSS
jgi:hypothetical protein